MSASWVESLRELRAEYLRRSPERLAEIEALLARATKDPGDPETLGALRLKFHSIAGTAATFGFAGATEPARSAEALVDEARARREPLSAETLGVLADALARLRALFEPPSGAGPEPEAATEPADVDRAWRVLAVTADPGEAAFVEAVLESGGHVVRVCTSAANVEADSRAFRPDLLLVDSELPGVAEHDVARLFGVMEGRPDFPVVFLDVGGGSGGPTEPSEATRDVRLVKPVAPGVLLSTVTALLERARSAAARPGSD